MRRLFDSALFWIALGGAVTVSGGIVLSVGAGIAISNKASMWSERWFDAGFAIVVVGAAMLLWALVLFLAHRHAAQHWCPDPEAHRLPRPSVAAPASATETSQLRSVLNQMHSDVRHAISQIERWQSIDGYGGLGEPPLRDGAWKKNRKSLARLPGMSELLTSLEDAFSHVKRIQGFMFMRNIKRGPVPASDRLPEALTSLRTAEAALRQKLEEVDAKP